MRNSTLLLILACLSVMVMELPSTVTSTPLSSSHLVRREESGTADGGFTNSGRKGEDEDDNAFATPTKTQAPTTTKASTVTKASVSPTKTKLAKPTPTKKATLW